MKLYTIDCPACRVLEKKLTRQQFADLLGVSDTSVRRWELGNSHISRKKFEGLKKFL